MVVVTTAIPTDVVFKDCQNMPKSFSLGLWVYVNGFGYQSVKYLVKSLIKLLAHSIS